MGFPSEEGKSAMWIASLTMEPILGKRAMGMFVERDRKALTDLVHVGAVARNVPFGGAAHEKGWPF